MATCWLQQGARSQLLRLLTLRFGTVPEDVETRLQTLNLNQLEELLEIALTVDANRTIRPSFALN